YIQVVERHVEKWNKEDKDLGINLSYSTQTMRLNGKGTLIHVKLLIFEKVGLHETGDGGGHVEGLPTYSA
ncbi:UNVERIFIED_CONTAM: hypothetical protein HDU68_000709, partial [Siphonaria sp. JEL0065]